MTNLKVFLVVSVLLFSMLVTGVNAQMSSAYYRIASSVISGGGNVMSSANYSLVSTFGQSSPPGNASGTSHIIDSGFWYTILLDIVGDVNGDGSVNLEDVITSLQVVTGQTPTSIIKEADADGDGKIGLSETLHILRKLGE